MATPFTASASRKRTSRIYSWPLPKPPDLMKGFFLSLRSEFYKTRKTAGFWSAIFLPVVLCLIIAYNFYKHADNLHMLPSMILWLRFSGIILGVMGTLLLPM